MARPVRHRGGRSHRGWRPAGASSGPCAGRATGRGWLRRRARDGTARPPTTCQAGSAARITPARVVPVPAASQTCWQSGQSRAARPWRNSVTMARRPRRPARRSPLGNGQQPGIARLPGLPEVGVMATAIAAIAEPVQGHALGLQILDGGRQTGLAAQQADSGEAVFPPRAASACR